MIADDEGRAAEKPRPRYVDCIFHTTHRRPVGNVWGEPRRRFAENESADAAALRRPRDLPDRSRFIVAKVDGDIPDARHRRRASRADDDLDPVAGLSDVDVSVKLSNKTLYSQQYILWLENFSHCDLSREEKAIVVLGYDGKIISPNDIWNSLGIVDTDDFRRIVTSLIDKQILSSTISKPRASRIAQLSKINKRDVPRFKITVPDQNAIQSTARHKVTANANRVDTSPDIYDESARLYLGNLPQGLTREDWINAFRERGFAVDVFFPRRQKRSSYLFLQFESKQLADVALVALNGLEIGNHVLVARQAYPMWKAS